MKPGFWGKLTNVETYQAIFSKVATIITKLKTFGKDHFNSITHLILSFMLSVWLSVLVGPFLGVILTFSLGLLKEYINKFYLDLKWNNINIFTNSIGIILAIIYWALS